MKKVFLGSFLSSLLLLVSASDASAAGFGLDAGSLDAKTRSELKAEIEKARVVVPELFKQVDDIAIHAKELDASARTQGIPLTNHFKPLGNRAFYPMMELLVFDAPPAVAAGTKDMPASSQAALRLGLIEAIGSVRDAHAIPVFAKLVDTTKDNDTLRASAEGLARIGTDDAVAILISAAEKSRSPEGTNDREKTILSGMRDCRRESAARFLAKRLRDTKNVNSELAAILMKSLGGVGNAWAWKTSASSANRAEEAATRAFVAQTLIDAYGKYAADKDVREAATKALLTVDDPSTPALIASAKKSASAENAPAFDELDRRFANNPSR